MISNLDKYKSDLKVLIRRGQDLFNGMQLELNPKGFKEAAKKKFKNDEEVKKFIGELPGFKEEYQLWYSEAMALIKQLLPDRLADFIKYYEKPKTRKDISYGNYVIEDYLQGLNVTRGGNTIVGPSAAVPQFQQQLYILVSVKERFKSSLFDIRQLVQADLFDSELEAAKELIKHKFVRAAGAIAGVVLEKHLHQVAINHNLSVGKKNPTINDFNELLKNNNVIDTPQWRFIQHLGDIRNLCDHNKDREPNIDEANDLISGVEKTIKTTY